MFMKIDLKKNYFIKRSVFHPLDVYFNTPPPPSTKQNLKLIKKNETNHFI